MNNENKGAFEPPVLTILTDDQFNQGVIGGSTEKVSWDIGSIQDINQ